jgi:hypothetical protein
MIGDRCCKACFFARDAALLRVMSVLCSPVDAPSQDECGDAGHVDGEGMAVAVGVQGWIEHLCAYDNRVRFGNASILSPSSTLTRPRFIGRGRGDRCDNVRDCACFGAGMAEDSSLGEDGGGEGVGEGVW